MRFLQVLTDCHNSFTGKLSSICAVLFFSDGVFLIAKWQVGIDGFRRLCVVLKQLDVSLRTVLNVSITASQYNGPAAVAAPSASRSMTTNAPAILVSHRLSMLISLGKKDKLIPGPSYNHLRGIIFGHDRCGSVCPWSVRQYVPMYSS